MLSNKFFTPRTKTQGRAGAHFYPPHSTHDYMHLYQPIVFMRREEKLKFRPPASRTIFSLACCLNSD